VECEATHFRDERHTMMRGKTASEARNSAPQKLREDVAKLY